MLSYPADSAKLSLAPAELGRQWNIKIQVNPTRVRDHQCHRVKMLHMWQSREINSFAVVEISKCEVTLHLATAQ